MSRHDDWPQRLAAYLQAVRPLPFQWVGNDCCTFAAGAVQSMTGADPMAPLRGRYRSQAGAARLIKRAGGLQALVAQHLGAPLASPALAQRGDVVLFEMAAPFGPHALGVCTGTSFVAPGPAGAVQVSMTAALVAWRI